MRPASPVLSFIAAVGAATALLFSTAASAAPSCEVDRPVRFSGLNWESNLVLAGIERFIVEHGYGCKTAVEIGETLAMLAALQRGDVDITPEVWPGQIEVAWDKAIKSGRVQGVGHVFDAGEGWYIPRYTQERHPELKSAADLARFSELFTDPEEPSKGRIYGCPAGWSCDILNTNLFKALKLEEKYTMFAPGSGAAQKAAIVSAYKRKRDIVFYYWTPTALVGSLDLVKLELPPFDAAAYTCLTDPNCADPVATEFKSNRAVTGMNTDFARAAPQLTEFFTKLTVPGPVIDDTLGWLETEQAEPEEAALYFLRKYPEVWKKWVPEDVATRVQAKL
ncbi:ABC transporter substrate-binding protein [Bordetella sp. 02P26C-1]|uniref:ABC transporter substrate-binding protein n=1 Tax=Bordetella sp. 02P26C-1 TaxID=2683195 RepID=UPI0013550727|nr:ABC transporter substrate-binding protein [Bordetella sp. 02P26C-1]MVW77927.1 glycine/betaine ABC transporter substrate-binding protein [Bordetella sp. 02P26C-1]